MRREGSTAIISTLNGGASKYVETTHRKGRGRGMAVRKSMGYAVIKKFLLIPKAKNSYIPLPINKTAKTQRRCSHGNYSLRNEDLKTRLLFLYVTAAMADATFFFPPPPPSQSPDFRDIRTYRDAV